MKCLVISKPIYDYVLPLVEFPQDGDKFYINNSIKTISNIGSLIAITLAKYGLDVSFTGMLGEDDTANKIKDLFHSYNIDTKYIETSYTEKTCVNYKIYNSKSNCFTTITENSIKANLTKYKYEFIPDVVIMDDGDYNANLAAINNYPNSKLIYVGEKFTKDSLVYCNKCNYIISNLKFASEATGVVNNLNKPSNIVQLFQKFIDLYNANLIIKLDNFDILYCINDEVRLIKNINKNIKNKDNIYYSILVYFLTITNDIENSIKKTNQVMLNSLSDLDFVKNIPNYEDIKDIIVSNNPKSNSITETNENSNLDQNKQDVNTNNQNVNLNQTNQITSLEKNIQTVNTPVQNQNSNLVETGQTLNNSTDNNNNRTNHEAYMVQTNSNIVQNISSSNDNIKINPIEVTNINDKTDNNIETIETPRLFNNTKENGVNEIEKL